MKSNLLIIIPVFNEDTIIAQVLQEVLVEGYSNICLVDDGSTDQTLETARQYPIVTLRHPINRGAGAAVQTGLSFAKKNNFQHAILMDGDGQHAPADIRRLMTRMEETGADIIIGNRFLNKENKIPRKRIIYNKIANVFTNFLCKDQYSDTQSGFRLLNSKAIERLKLRSRGYDFCSEMVIVADRLNLKIDQTPIQVNYSDYSLNKGQNLLTGIRTARNILWQNFFEAHR